MPNIKPNPDIDLQQISIRNTHARNIIDGCAVGPADARGHGGASWTDALSDYGHARRAAHAILG